MRFTFARRIGLIVVLSLTVAWIAYLSLLYVFGKRASMSDRPLPRQVVAVVKLVEAAKTEEYPLIFKVLNTQELQARIEKGQHIGVTGRERVPRVTARVLRRLFDETGGRPFSVDFSRTRGEPRPISRVTFVKPVDLIFRVGLKSGDTLVIEATSRPMMNIFGLPVGFTAGFMGTLIGLIALIAMHRETRPLARLATAVDQMDPGGEPVFLPDAKSSAPEIRALIAAFNRLQGRLSLLLRSRMAMLGGISHDVRTFATRLRLRVDLIPEGVERDRAILDIADMIRLLDDALLASRAGAGELTQALVELDQVVREEVNDRRAEGRPVDLKDGASGESATVLGDRLALRRVVANLIDNAIQYGRAAHVQIQASGAVLELIVDDEGAGIPQEQREALLEPFVRLETSRNRRTGGAGLGLAVVRNLVEAHAGAIGITDAPGGGARFTVRLPLFRA
jgi:signal transduction histidine kinase